MNVSDLDNALATGQNVDGIPVKIQGRTVVIAPLFLGAIRRHKDTLVKIRDRQFAGTLEMIEAAEPVITESIARNYPAWTKELSEEFIDLGNFNSIFSAIMLASKLARPQSETKPGEAGPVTAPDSVDSSSNRPSEVQAQS